MPADEGVALLGLFIIDKEGVIQHATINNLAFGRNVDETIRILQVSHIAMVCEVGAPICKPDAVAIVAAGPALPRAGVACASLSLHCATAP